MMDVLYHFTDTARLPWVADSGELRPGRNRIGSFPEPDFLWATTSDQGDRTAAVSREAWRSDVTRLVRFTLAFEDFVPWRTIPAAFPQWTPEQVARLESVARKMGETDFGKWHCRAEPLPLDCVLNLGTRTWAGPWRPLPALVLGLPRQEPEIRSIVIDGRAYLSRRTSWVNGASAYEVCVPL